MADLPLQKELIDAVIEFANATLEQGDQVLAYFCGRWQLDSTPTLRTCRTIQAETRRWLSLPNEDSGFLLALLGRDFRERVDAGVQLNGQVYFRLEKLDDVQSRVKVTWNWWAKKASLRTICGLAVATIHDAGLSKHVHLCAHDACDNIFIDDKSRGTPREYCKIKKCLDRRNRESTAATRRDPKRKRK